MYGGFLSYQREHGKAKQKHVLALAWGYNPMKKAEEHQGVRGDCGFKLE